MLIDACFHTVVHARGEGVIVASVIARNVGRLHVVIPLLDGAAVWLPFLYTALAPVDGKPLFL